MNSVLIPMRFALIAPGERRAELGLTRGRQAQIALLQKRVVIDQLPVVTLLCP